MKERRRLGDLLLQKKLVTPAQLDEALRSQMIFGGRLGTALIESGVLDETTVTAALAEQYGVSPADAALLDRVPKNVLDLVPAETAERGAVVPLAVDGRRLTVLTADPSALAILDEIAFRTGLIVRPVVAAELRVQHMLERCYGVSRDRRYIHVPRRLDLPEPPSAPPPAAGKKDLLDGGDDEEDFWGLGADADGAGAGAGQAVPPPAPAAVSAVVPEPIEEILETVEPVCDAAELARRLAEARDRNEIVSALSAYLDERFSAYAIGLVRGATLYGCACSGGRDQSARFAAAEFSLDGPSAFKTATESRTPFLGPLARSAAHGAFLQALGTKAPVTALIVPIVLSGRVIGLLYVAAGSTPGIELLELQGLAARATLAFEILVLKNKLLSLQ